MTGCRFCLAFSESEQKFLWAQGVFHAEPYKSELLPLWKFKDAAAARESSEAVFRKFTEYRQQDDFVGMDMARKYLQMGYTRSRRYAKHKGGNKSQILEEEDPVKAQSAVIFQQKWQEAAADERYQELKKQHQGRKK